jgi:hypothetical protein
MKTTTTEILNEANRLGIAIALAPDGYLEIFPRSKVPRDFLAAVRANKTELRKFLEARTRAHLAKQVLLGEFDNCKRATLKRVANELALDGRLLCQRAIAHLHQKARK